MPSALSSLQNFFQSFRPQTSSTASRSGLDAMQAQQQAMQAQMERLRQKAAELGVTIPPGLNIRELQAFLADAARRHAQGQDSFDPGPTDSSLKGLQDALAEQTKMHAQIQELAMKSATESAWHQAIQQTIGKI